uniref:Chromosome 8 open reading frame 76 n=1 Tax=Panthera leo TaxID=9689 RepID=A0A8C8WN41_PANLE
METGCWLLGGEFEDSVFEERRERRPGLPASYRAKRCEPQWFYEETGSSDDVEALTLKKFKGDLAYRRQEYQKALQEYSSISEKLPSTNFAMKRDVQEGQARCLVHLGRHTEALEIAANLENKATNTDHLTTVLYLQFAICSSLQNLEKTILCLQKLISLHPFDPWNWGKLAEAYLSLGPALSTLCASSQKQDGFTSSDKTIKSSLTHSGKDCLLCFPETLPESPVFSVEASSSNNQKNEKALKNIQNCVAEKREAVLLETQLKACASFVRTRLLLQLTESQQTSFALERNLRTQQEIADKMKEFGFKEDTLLLIAEVMGEDIVPEKIKDEVHTEVKCVGPTALTALVIASSKEFEDKWFRKIKDHFCPFENQFHTEIQILV